LARLRSDQPLTDADIAALDRLDDGPDGPGIDPDDFDPDCAPPEWWLAMSAEQKAWLDDPEPVPAQPDVLDAGFTHHGGSGGIGFAAGGLLDRMDACEELVICAGRVWDAGLARLSDGELVGLIGAARRLTSRQAALELAAVGELAARRAGPNGAPGEHLDDEVAALLRLTGPAAARRVALAAAIGTSDNPGESDRYGVIDSDTCRDLAGTLAIHPATRWCITLVDRNGQAVGHGCARAGPGPPGSDRPAWLATVTITPVEIGTCQHRRESAGYRPSPGLRHIVKIRSPRCGFPGCRRRAARCDDDHTIPHHNGGRTCECNLHPLCRRHQAGPGLAAHPARTRSADLDPAVWTDHHHQARAIPGLA
jgi:hypothetical protein